MIGFAVAILMLGGWLLLDCINIKLLSAKLPEWWAAMTGFAIGLIIYAVYLITFYT